MENRVNLGTPDVNYALRLKCGSVIEGWIELKQLDRWPTRISTVVHMKRYTREQQLWLLLRAGAGGRAHLFLKVGQDSYLLFDAEGAQRVGMVNRHELYALAIMAYQGRAFPVDQLLNALATG